ncbi:MAG: hypothetical protein J5518_03025 [Lachnospiraceae bacterium]|nr:hypothetical protein [Lachnospiraceae bacterium]
MDSIRDRFNGRDRMGSDRGGRDRYDRQDRGEALDRAPRRSAPSYSPEGPGVDVDAIADVIEQSNSKQLEVFADCIDDVKDEVYASEKEIMKAIDQMASSVNGAGRAASRYQEPAMAQMDPATKEEILRAVANNTDLLQAIRETLQKKEEEKKEAENAPEEGAAQEQPAEKEESSLSALLSQFYNNMEEHVHKENVKCYRNVQAALSEQGTQVVDQNRKSLGLLKVLAIVSIVLSLVNAVLLISYIFNFI